MVLSVPISWPMVGIAPWHVADVLLTNRMEGYWSLNQTKQCSMKVLGPSQIEPHQVTYDVLAWLIHRKTIALRLLLKNASTRLGLNSMLNKPNTSSRLVP
mmetsp:Transcript_36685/g.74882  ORF Transcript_36685/g.74882 Transcript_36685/m.74882 type:complete len:100 (+) Transcript_36685:203-502(+)